MILKSALPGSVRSRFESFIFSMLSAALAFPNRDGREERPWLNAEDGAEVVCDFVRNHVSYERMGDIAGAFGERFRDMVGKLPFSERFANKLVEDVESRKKLVKSAMRRMSMGVYGGR